jgi:hypothetical protein
VNVARMRTSRSVLFVVVVYRTVNYGVSSVWTYFNTESIVPT